MMAYRAYTADALSDFCHLKVWATFAEFFQSAEFIHVEERLFHLALFIQMYGDPPVTFDACHRFNGDFSRTHSSSPQSYLKYCGGKITGTRPASSSDNAKKIESALGGQPGMKRSTFTTSPTPVTLSRGFPSSGESGMSPSTTLSVSR